VGGGGYVCFKWVSMHAYVLQYVYEHV
jgi:hypothetical protein